MQIAMEIPSTENLDQIPVSLQISIKEYDKKIK